MGLQSQHVSSRLIPTPALPHPKNKKMPCLPVLAPFSTKCLGHRRFQRETLWNQLILQSHCRNEIVRKLFLKIFLKAWGIVSGKRFQSINTIKEPRHLVKTFMSFCVLCSSCHFYTERIENKTIVSAALNKRKRSFYVPFRFPKSCSRIFVK